MKLLRTMAAMLFIFMFTIGVCEAATAETINDGEALVRIKRLAIAYPDYWKTLEKEPTNDELMNAIYEASRSSRTYVLSYEEMATRIKSDTGIDIRVLPKADARKIFREHAYKYADGYLFVTLANNSKVNMFCEVYAVNSNDLVYILRIESGKSDDSKTTKAYKMLAEQFYRSFDKAAQSEAKKNKD